jgi:hypothetical protein
MNLNTGGCVQRLFLRALGANFFLAAGKWLREFGGVEGRGRKLPSLYRKFISMFLA